MNTAGQPLSEFTCICLTLTVTSPRSADGTETREVVSYARPPSGRSVKELRYEYSRSPGAPLTLHLNACFSLVSRAKASHQVFLAQGHSAGYSRAKLVSSLPSQAVGVLRGETWLWQRAVADGK